MKPPPPQGMSQPLNYSNLLLLFQFILNSLLQSGIAATVGVETALMLPPTTVKSLIVREVGDEGLRQQGELAWMYHILDECGPHAEELLLLQPCLGPHNLKTDLRLSFRM